MGEENQGGTGTPGASDENTNEQKISNNELKNHPVFLEVTEKLGKMQAAEDKRVRDEAAAATEAERKKLEDKQLYEEALSKQKSEFESMIEGLKRENVEKGLANRLLQEGFKNETFLKGAIAGYDPEGSSVEDYVKALSSDEANKIFLGNGKVTQKPDVPTPKSNTKQMSPAELKAALKDRDPKVRAKARLQAEKNWLKTGSTGVESK